MIETIYSPSFREITFADRPKFDARGSNGYMKVSGITLLQMINDEIHISCVDSRGRQSDAVRIPIPKSAVVTLANSLLAMVEADQVTGKEAVITPAQADAAKTLISIAVNSTGEHADLERTLLEALDADRIIIKG
ncbi:hypothetical protein [Microvirga sp. VF16]|uniref:hypothetical protein n=1 Tax=Microvirga sp. VF16 TaxID=2807101 RepID=UPI00193D2556|nr:hypothetical protein [Microvirga sp. VF16]QRM34776.1 hypothetical protein JO965_41675 [Microvirga sp. VF16]